MKLIDREPTQGMCEAAYCCMDEGPEAIYKAMYDAAPEILQEPVAFEIEHDGSIPKQLSYEKPTAKGWTVSPLYTFTPDAQAEIVSLQQDKEEAIAVIDAVGKVVDYDFSGGLAEKVQAEISKRDARIAELEQDLQTTADALGHAHQDIERLERESSACDLLDEQAEQIKELEETIAMQADKMKFMASKNQGQAAEITRLKEVIANLEKDCKQFRQDAMDAFLDDEESIIAKQAVEISRLRGVIAKCKNGLLSQTGSLSEQGEEALAAIEEEGL